MIYSFTVTINGGEAERGDVLRELLLTLVEHYPGVEVDRSRATSHEPPACPKEWTIRHAPEGDDAAYSVQIIGHGPGDFPWDRPLVEPKRAS